MYSNSQLSDIVSDQVVSGVTILKEIVGNINPPLNLAAIIALSWIKKNWRFLLYFVILRRIYRAISFKKIWKRLHIKSSARLEPQIAEASGSLSSSNSPELSMSMPVNSNRTSIFHATEKVPNANQVLMTDGMILVNRDDRYLEIYERRKVSKVENIDDQVQELLQQFLPRNQKKT